MNKSFITTITSSKREGIAIISAIFIAVIGLLITMTMLSVSSSNTNQISDNKNGTIAYYAAEAGLADARNLFNSDSTNLGKTLSDLELPEAGSESILDNGSSYYVESITYSNNNQTALINIIGNYKDASRKIRAKLDTVIPNAFNNYGLLTNGVLTIHGTKTLKMNVHANNGLSFSGGTTMLNNAVATQSNDLTAGAPNSQTNAIGGYVAKIDVPEVPIAEYRTKGKSSNILLNIGQADLMTRINNAPAGSNIYISGTNNKSSINLSGNMLGKFIFIDGNIIVNASGLSNLSNVMVVAAGTMEVNGSGSIDVGTSHAGQLDTVFASTGNITLNGSRSFDSMFWTNDVFTQNGASLAGRVISQDAILFNGAFTLNQSNKLYNNGAFATNVNVSTWQVVPVE